ncbi:MAG TPA: diguanylate cyclase [Burkholderiaceae bacterium]|nr:diguanylate cyclase [Burkholderiaceae bacterium]
MTNSTTRQSVADGLSFPLWKGGSRPRGMGLSARVALGTAALLFVASFVIIAIALWRLENEMTAVISNQQSALLQQTADHLAQRLQTRRAVMAALARRIAHQRITTPAALHAFIEQQESTGVLFDDFIVTNANGDVLSRLRGLNAPINVSDRNYFKRTLESRTSFVSEPVYSRASGEAVMVLSEPVFDLDERLVFVLLGSISLESRNFLSQIGRRVGDGGYQYLMTTDGVYVAHPNQGLVLQSVDRTLDPNLAQLRALAGFEGTITTTQATVTFKRIDDTPWIAAAVTPASEVQAPILALRRQAFAIAAAFAALLMPLAWWITRHQMRPLVALRDRIRRMRRDLMIEIDDAPQGGGELGDLSREFVELMRERRYAEQGLRQQRALLQSVNDALPLGLFHCDPHGQCIYVNHTYERITGLTSEQCMGEGWVKAVHADDRAALFKRWNHFTQHGHVYNGEHRMVRPDGSMSWVSVHAAPIMIDNALHGYVGSVEDITARREADRALRASELRVRTITDALPVLVGFFDAAQRYRFVNRAYERWFDRPADDIVGNTICELMGEAQYRPIERYITRALAGECVIYDREFGANETWQCQECTLIPQFDEDGATVLGCHVMTRDVTAAKLEERRLARLAEIDSLTGLANRAGFDAHLSGALRRSRETERFTALMYLDLDRFKSINDTWGHGAGDRLLRAFATRLCAALRTTDIVARLGGDEFAVIVEGLNDARTAERLAEKIVLAMEEPFELDPQWPPLIVTTSIGVAFTNGRDCDPHELVQQADAMLYEVKNSGRNGYRVTGVACGGVVV